MSTHTMTLDGTALGTPAYMAPEQINGQKVDAKADQFSLAVLAYELLAHRSPFSAPNYQALMYQIVNAEPAPLVEAPELDHVIRRALSKKPEQRYATCGAFAEALMPLETPTIRTIVPKRSLVKPTLFAFFLLIAAAVAIYFGHPKPVEKIAVTPVAPVITPPPAPKPETAKAPDVVANSKDGLRYVLIGDFRIGQTEVTQEAYRTITGKTPSHFKGPKLPVENISWKDAQKYCKAIGGRLPTEKEWAYAAQGSDKGWFSENSNETTHAVEQKPANGYGLYDMLGNVWEWTADDYGNGAKVVRGGAWDTLSPAVSVSFRGRIKPGDHAANLGFRCVE